MEDANISLWLISSHSQWHQTLESCSTFSTCISISLNPGVWFCSVANILTHAPQWVLFVCLFLYLSGALSCQNSFLLVLELPFLLVFSKTTSGPLQDTQALQSFTGFVCIKDLAVWGDDMCMGWNQSSWTEIQEQLLIDSYSFATFLKMDIF